VTRLIQPAPQLTVELDPHGAPAWITAGPLRGAVMPLSRWVVDQDWWETPIRREYWKVMWRGRGGGTDPAEAGLPGRHEGESSPPLDPGERLLAEIYQDLAGGHWFLERLYD
jgi:hypothetical protein